MRGTEGPAWADVIRAFEERRPFVVLLDRDSGRWLDRWRTSALAEGRRWLESPPCPTNLAPFDLWTHLAETRSNGRHLAHRLRFGAHREDPACPLLPDPVGAHRAIFEWLTADPNQPQVVVIDAVDEADQDCLAALSYVVRALEDEPIVVVLRTSGRAPGGHWDDLLPRLVEETTLLRVDGDRVERDRRRTITLGTPTLDYGFACCRVGALRTGSRILAQELTNDDGRLSKETEARAWQYLAMAMLRLRNFQFVSTAVTGGLALDLGPQQRRLLRRILMLALHGQGESKALRELGMAARQDLKDHSVDSLEEAWLRLDAALGCSMDDPEHLHENLLKSIAERPDCNASVQCRAAAHLWLAASRTLSGDSVGAVDHQRAGLKILEALQDESRALPVRIRLGVTLFALESYAEAAPHFETAARQAKGSGDLEMVAECLCYAARAHIAMGNLLVADELLGNASGRRRKLWAPRRARLLRLHALSVLALARAESTTAAAMAQTLQEEMGGELVGAPAWTARLNCECAYLLADIAAARGDVLAARRWASHGLRLCEHAAIEERLALTSSGEIRLLRLPSR
jgi:tetratricopeptide (TPR) repeat protein